MCLFLQPETLSTAGVVVHACNPESYKVEVEQWGGKIKTCLSYTTALSQRQGAEELVQQSRGLTVFPGQCFSTHGLRPPLWQTSISKKYLHYDS